MHAEGENKTQQTGETQSCECHTLSVTSTIKEAENICTLEYC